MYKYEANDKTYDLNSEKNLRIRKQFVHEQEFTCVTDMVEELMKASVAGWDFDDFYNNAREGCPHCSGTVGEVDSKGFERYCYDNELDYAYEDSDGYYQCEDCERIFLKSEAGSVYGEPFEYYIVYPSLGKDLKELGEMVLERYGGWIWGRQITGQAVFLDYIIGQLCYKYEMLEGQKYEMKTA